MRVVIVGGYGAFGLRLADMLRRDQHEVWLAGRDLSKAAKAAGPIGAQALRVDLSGDLSPLFAPRPDVVIDAAGPYHSYGDDPMRLAKQCLSEGANYFDLSDDAVFTGGVATLDEAAISSERRILSGASSVPGLSSAVVAELAREMKEVLLIDIALLPGNKAPRGRSVMESIVRQIGRPTKVWRGGQWRTQRNWTDRRQFDLSKGMTRAGYLIEVSDTQLFPKAFQARSVVFRAGMELQLMNIGIAALGWIRRFINIPTSPMLISALKTLSDLLLPFGSDTGGMQIAVTGTINGEPVQRTWTLVAKDGDGPFVPGVVCRALLRNLNQITPGARPCIAELSLVDIEDAMSDLAISTHRQDTARPPLFQTILADRWAKLSTEARAVHNVQDVDTFSGTANVTRGTSWIARIIAKVFGFPSAGQNIPVTVTMTRIDNSEIWERNFDGRIFRSHCTPSPKPYHFVERFGPFSFEIELPVRDGVMTLPVRRGWFLGVPIPRRFLPGSESSEFIKDGIFHFDVSMIAPVVGGLIVRYRGNLSPDRMIQSENGGNAINSPHLR